MRCRFAVAVFLVEAAFCQDVAILRRGDFHIQGFGGFNFAGGVNRVSTTQLHGGLTDAQLLTPNTNGAIGIQADYSITRRLQVQAEYSYLAGGSLAFNQDLIDPETGHSRRVAADAHSSARIGGLSMLIRFPVLRRPRLAPYLGIGAGVVRTHFALKQAQVGDPAALFSGSSKTNDMVGSGGGGVRYYFTERLGMSADLRFIAGPNSRTIGRFAVGLFFKAH